jgi:hypothetical protein
VKPGDHPDFFRFAPPPGTSRESTIVLDRRGELWHEGERIERGPLSRALHRWIAVHPDDGRFILTNGYDWCYFTVEDTPYFVEAISSDDAPILTLSDQSTEPLDPDDVYADDEGALYTRVKGRRHWARFGRHAEAELARLLAEDEPPRILSGGREHLVRSRPRSSGELGQ